MSIQQLLIENSNRPEVQQKIREAAMSGAADAGFNLIVGYDNQVKFGTQESYENQEAAIAAAWEKINEISELEA